MVWVSLVFIFESAETYEKEKKVGNVPRTSPASTSAACASPHCFCSLGAGQWGSGVGTMATATFECTLRLPAKHAALEEHMRGFN